MAYVNMFKNEEKATPGAHPASFVIDNLACCDNDAGMLHCSQLENWYAEYANKRGSPDLYKSSRDAASQLHRATCAMEKKPHCLSVVVDPRTLSTTRLTRCPSLASGYLMLISVAHSLWHAAASFRLCAQIRRAIGWIANDRRLDGMLREHVVWRHRARARAYRLQCPRRQAAEINLSFGTLTNPAQDT